MSFINIPDVSFIEQVSQRIKPIDLKILRLAEARQKQLIKPDGSLGRLEEVANRCAAIFGALSFSVSHPRIVIFAGDHGICAEGISPYPQVVTAQMVRNYLSGDAGINCLARSCGIEVKFVDVGVIGHLEGLEGLISRNIAKGTQNFCSAPAMTRQETFAALRVGVEMAEEAVVDGCNLLGFGEMGIGNTTTAGAITAALTGCTAGQSVGRGAGADDECLQRKISVVERAMILHREHLSDPLEILMRVGGLEIAAMCGFCLGAAANRIPVLTDGFIATSAAALAVRINPIMKDYLFASHASVEQGHQRLLAIIEQVPLLNLGMRLGEGTGVALAMKVVQAGVVALTEMATFDSAGVSTAQGALLAQ